MKVASPLKLQTIRPLVRYVDTDQAVVEIHVEFAAPLPGSAAAPPPRRLEALVEVDNDSGFHDEQRLPVHLHGQAATLRLDLVQPQLWWPAGMGEQSMYRLTVSLYGDKVLLDAMSVQVGLTSIRSKESGTDVLIVNGRECAIRHVLAVDMEQERQLLPVAGHSLLVVRDHWGTDVLYDAADRAGVLLLQCVPIDPEGQPEREIAQQVDRLAPHPSLAGWFVGHLGCLRERLSYCLQSLDPARPVFRCVHA